MFDLTPGERRGALVLIALVLLGAGADLLRIEPSPTPAPPELPAPAATPAAGVSGSQAAAAPLDLNTASEAELDRLPGIGPVLAGRIVAHRTAHGRFRTREDLLAVPGIGPRLYERLAPLVTVAPAVPVAAAPLQNASGSGR